MLRLSLVGTKCHKRIDHMFYTSRQNGLKCQVSIFFIIPVHGYGRNRRKSSRRVLDTPNVFCYCEITTNVCCSLFFTGRTLMPVTLEAIAKAAGYSVSTVSRALTNPDYP